jgi:hypothetical protein
MTAPASIDVPRQDRTALALLIAVAISLATVAGWLLGGTGSGELQTMLRAVGFGHTAAIEAEQHDQAASIARLEQAMRVVVGDIATLKLRDTVSRNDTLLETRLGLFDDAINALKARVAAQSDRPAAETWRAPVEGLDAALARNGIEIDALRTSIDAQQQSYRTSMAAMAKRIDRVETLMAAREVTSSIRIRPAPARAKARRRHVQAVPAARVLPGWTVTHAEPGFAVVSGQDGTFGVAPGALIPSLGRVTEVRQSDNRWVVTTEKGLIGQ